MKRDFSMSAAMAINATAMFTVAAGFEVENLGDYFIRMGMILTGVFSVYIGSAFFKRALDQ
mgnify:FL=1